MMAMKFLTQMRQLQWQYNTADDNKPPARAQDSRYRLEELEQVQIAWPQATECLLIFKYGGRL